ncbi:IS110 family transposase [Streptomyces sp. NPDC050095]|uniref:IS110 family transposase n=1 Tax=unclassified Streptomyces TaxID=2593676 RepID=UPI0034138523
MPSASVVRAQTRCQPVRGDHLENVIRIQQCHEQLLTAIAERLGIGTHRDVHVAAVMSTTGQPLAVQTFPAAEAGYRQLLGWAEQFGTARCAGVEGMGSYGAALSRHLLSHHIEVFEVAGLGGSARRRRGKSDPADAVAAARAVVSGRARTHAKSGDGPIEIARLYRGARLSAVKARTQAVNQLKAVLVTADPALREELTALPRRQLVHACVTLIDGKDAANEEPLLQATRFTLHILAVRIEQLTAEARQLQLRQADLLERHFPMLLAAVGVGPESAAVLLIAMGDNLDRLRGESSFAALCGVSPVEYSSGGRRQRRLNRGGNRQANAALHCIVLSRLRWDPRTQAYYARRIEQGKTRREIIRCLKRYVAREVYRLVQERPATGDETAGTAASHGGE